MVTQVIEFVAPTGQTLTGKLFAVGSDTVVASAAATEATNRKSVYTVSFTDIAAATYEVIALDGASVPMAHYWVDLLLADDTFQTYDTPLSVIQSGLATAAALATAQADLDIITGADGVNLLSATQTQITTIAADVVNIDGAAMRGTDNAALAATALSTATWTGTLATNIETTNATVATNLNATISSRMETYTQPTGFLAATFPTDVAGLTALSSAHGAGSWATATGFSAHSAADVWLAGTRTLTSFGFTVTPSNAADVADIQSRLPATLVGGRMDASVGAMQANTLTASALAADAVTEIFAGVLTSQLTEAYAADGVAPTLAQAVFLIQQSLTNFTISGTTTTIKKIDGVTTAATLTLDDDTTPTGVTRAT